MNDSTNVIDDLVTFKQWMDDEGIYLNPSLDIVKLEDYGRSIIANTLIKEGDVLIRVPRNVMMSRTGIELHIPKEIRSIIDSNRDDIGSTDGQAVYLMYSLLNKDSYWHQYTSILPKQFTTSIYFDQDEMKELQLSKLRYFTESRLSGIERHYNVIFKKLSSLNDEFKKKEYTFELFKWALSCIWSRAFSLSSDDGGMVPLADMFNAIEKAKSKVRPDSRADQLIYYASKDIERGEQVFTPYGVYKTIGNAQMLMDYGFAFDDPSEGDTIQLTLDNFSDDELYIDTKIDLLEQLDIVREFNLKRNQLPQELLIYARVKNLKENELQLAKEHYRNDDNRNKPVSRRNEKTALRYLSNYLSRYLDSYETTLSDDLELLEKNKEKKITLSYNMLNIIRIRKGEKEILKQLIDSFDKIREHL
ncbi:hypothetical protein PPL_06965 [Heterostelium album PN500]|uniref:SET domain-containing protein n=1 Tax=Heterostelium pallidum (strain ATCC 26659 / Pp 5 / PN500) TaxID=670386 RepID=D3BE12_HETP5|nr:hypothetical protein PPL_06965 [Heterostelium album PN500]EFA80143.1 hypothetical protein PPL_06965 [Heterostelium album PN500]|eukprot:XP_020432263.1 hypothetical protein PPL_06965 [Heterostelium album PN500]